jgi:hypothetical protein
MNPANEEYFHVEFNCIDLCIIHAGFRGKLFSRGIRDNLDGLLLKFFSVESYWLFRIDYGMF